MKVENEGKLASSFRDPQGFVFSHKGTIYRQINQNGKANFDRLTESGLAEKLIRKKWLVKHEEVNFDIPLVGNAYKIIQPEQIPFISYPYEWSFSQLKDAALLTLDIQNEAISYGMSLKDSSAFNVQFNIVDGRPIFIDTLSFEIQKTGQPWTAYRQFCQHFLAPLALMAFSDVRLNQLLRTNIDGIPLDLAWKLLPGKAMLRLGLLTHIYLHSKAQSRYADTSLESKKVSRVMTETQQLGVIDSLRRTILSLHWEPKGTEWGEYYDQTNYADKSFRHKQQLVSNYIEKAKPNTVWDLGANNGVFSRLASEKGISTISFDVDASAVEKNYLQLKRDSDPNLLPLLSDLTNPSPDLGWDNQERLSLPSRGEPDLVMALALLHHLAISNNLPLANLAQFFSRLSQWLIIEFVPKKDSQVKKLLISREDIFPDYTFEGFEKAFAEFFKTVRVEDIKDSERRLYLMKKK
jgi:ribosomal protein L11 methylase PrmA